MMFLFVFLVLHHQQSFSGTAAESMTLCLMQDLGRDIPGLIEKDTANKVQTMLALILDV